MTQQEEPRQRLIDLSRAVPSAPGRLAYKVASPVLDRLLGVSVLNKGYRGLHVDAEAGRVKNFFYEALNRLDITYEITDEDLAKIPPTGGVLVVSNHPFGAIDGVVLGAILSAVRPDVRLLVNFLLARIPELGPWIFAVDPFGGPEAATKNLRGIKQSIRHLREGGMVGTFPSGTVSHLHLKSRQVTDPQWLDRTAKLVRMSQPTVLPVYFPGQNSWLFQMAGLLHPRLRTGLLPREMVCQRGKTIEVRVGNPIPYRQLTDFPSEEALTEFLRLKSYVLKGRAHDARKPRRRFPLKRRPRDPVAKFEPVAPAVDKQLLAQDVAALPADRCLVEHNRFQVFCVQAPEIPHVLKEIGRLREQTFREIYEGTGRAEDLDKFDRFYRHLFVWDQKAQAIVGAYRMGAVDEIMRAHGRGGIYSSTLFKFKPGFYDVLQNGIELGRSFVVSEYQKKHASLFLLWKGICLYVYQNPRYHVLFGPVSITSEYQSISRDLMVQFLRQQVGESVFSPLRRLVKAKRPPRGKLRGSEKHSLLTGARDIDDVSAVISEVETDHKGAPTLLRHYLRMRGQIISFNIDPDFNYALDGLIVVDFLRSDPKLLGAYMGHDNLKEYLALWAQNPPAEDSLHLVRGARS
ncbi:MAG: lysophospholipid acyltransferase family protein [Opitutales bacterium]